VAGFLLVGVQVAGVVYAYLNEKADAKTLAQIEALEVAFAEAEARGVAGADKTAFVRARVAELTSGAGVKKKKSKKEKAKKSEPQSHAAQEQAFANPVWAEECPSMCRAPPAPVKDE